MEHQEGDGSEHDRGRSQLAPGEPAGKEADQEPAEEEGRGLGAEGKADHGVRREHRAGREQVADGQLGGERRHEQPHPDEERAPAEPLHESSACSGLSSGNSTTSRMLGESVNSIASRSIPMPSPAVGGMPCSSART